MTPITRDPRSHADASVAGWDCEPSPSIDAELAARAELLGPHDPGPAKFSWIRASVLLESRNDTLEKWAGEGRFGLRRVVNEVREGWVERLAGGLETERLVERFAIDRWAERGSLRLLAAGDTGEGDRSQVVTTPAVGGLAADADAMVILSDVVYPAGSVNQYAGKVHFPYRDVAAPILAVPGNHDWYDLLEGFMAHFCGAAESAPEARMGLLQRLLWRRGEARDAGAAAAEDRLRELPGFNLTQPGPYWTLDCDGVRFVAIDTGIDGSIDDAQGRWLAAVSSDPRPKLLLTGKPLVVNGCARRYAIEWKDPAAARFATVGELVRAPEHNYVAAIGGDVHNYQRYLCELEDGRRQAYVVAGGGGAFMHATHTIPRVAIEHPYLRCDEEETRLYPLRGDSLSRYSHLLPGPGRLLRIDRRQAALAIAGQLGLEPTRDEADAEALRPLSRTRAAALRRIGGKAFQRRISEILDWDSPPFFKHALEVEVSGGELVLRCRGITGCARHEAQPPVEDEVRIAL